MRFPSPYARRLEPRRPLQAPVERLESVIANGFVRSAGSTSALPSATSAVGCRFRKSTGIRAKPKALMIMTSSAGMNSGQPSTTCPAVRKKPSAEMKKAVPCSSRLYWRAPFTSCQGMRAPAACIAGTPWLAHGATFPMPLGVPRLAHFHPRAGPSVTAPSPRGTRRGRSRRRPPRSSRAGSPSSSAGALRPSTLPALLLHDAGGALPRDDGVRSLRRVHRSRAPPRMTGASGGSVRLSGDALVVTLDVFDHAREILLRARMRDRWHRIPSLGHYSARIRRAAGNGDPQPERKGKRLRLRQT